MIERQVEQALRKAVRIRRSGTEVCRPGLAGVPDRIVLMPNHARPFVELKAPGKHQLQVKRKRRLESLGFPVYCIDRLIRSEVYWMKYMPHDYQAYATDFILTHPEAAVLLDMGLGKSVITLSAIQELCLDAFEISQVHGGRVHLP